MFRLTVQVARPTGDRLRLQAHALRFGNTVHTKREYGIIFYNNMTRRPDNVFKRVYMSRVLCIVRLYGNELSDEIVQSSRRIYPVSGKKSEFVSPCFVFPQAAKSVKLSMRCYRYTVNKDLHLLQKRCTCDPLFLAMDQKPRNSRYKASRSAKWDVPHALDRTGNI